MTGNYQYNDCINDIYIAFVKVFRAFFQKDNATKSAKHPYKTCVIQKGVVLLLWVSQSDDLNVSACNIFHL